jgi:hypothetical protein
MNAELEKEAEKKLQHHQIDYIIQHLSSKKINIFFGANECIEVIRKFGGKPLNEYTPEEDFILGIMLGYCRSKQCLRYIKLKEKELLRNTINWVEIALYQNSSNQQSP